MTEDQKKSVDLAIKQMDKAFGKGALVRLGDKEIEPIESISTGSLGLDIALGGSGIPKGRVIEIYGPESSGKTTLTLHAIAECQKAGGVCAFIDAEHALDVKYAADIGVDTDNLLISQPECVSIDEFILTNKGYERFGDISEKDKVVTVNDKNKLTNKETTNFNYSNKDAFLLKTSTFQMECSNTHKIKTDMGYKKLKDLSLEDKIEYIYKHNLFSNKNKTLLNEELSFILGSFIADGNYNSSCPRFYNIDEDYIQKLNSYIKNNFPNTTWTQSGCTFRYKKNNSSSHNHELSDLKIFLNKYLGSVSGKDKFIPKEIFNSGKDNIKAFLSGYFLADGHTSKSGSLSISCSIKENILNISSLFNFLGIPTSIRERVKNNKFTYYELTMNSKEASNFFLKEMDIVGYKRNRLDAAKDKKESFIRFSNKTWELIFDEIKQKYKTLVSFYNELNNTNHDQHHFNTKRGISNEYLIKINKLLKSKKIKELLESNIAYSNIISISSLNKKVDMLDITVKEHHNFIINNMVVHNCGEQALEIVETLIRSGSVDLVIVDSVAALTPKVEIDGDMDDQQVGVQARLMSKALRKITGLMNNTNTTVIFINQIRMKIGMTGYGSPETTTGGNALKFYSSVRLDIRRIATLKQGENPIGNRTKVKVVKNKVAPPFRQAEFDIIFGEGVSKTGELIDYGVKFDIVEKAGAWFSYNDRKLGQGKENSKAFLDDPENEAIRNEIEEKILAKIAEAS
jgi:protein RecA